MSTPTGFSLTMARARAICAEDGEETHSIALNGYTLL